MTDPWIHFYSDAISWLGRTQTKHNAHFVAYWQWKGSGLGVCYIHRSEERGRGGGREGDDKLIFIFREDACCTCNRDVSLGSKGNHWLPFFRIQTQWIYWCVLDYPRRWTLSTHGLSTQTTQGTEIEKGRGIQMGKDPGGEGASYLSSFSL